jgi:nucleoid-associated protein YgaU
MILPGWQNKFSIFGGLLFLAAQTAVSAQDRGWADMLPGLKERAVVLNIVARVMERDEEEVWNSQNSKITIPGQPVGIKLVGANVVVAVQFTPYLRPNGPNVLVAQGQIWVEIPGQGIHYQTTMQTIPLEFGERIFFFPLGSVNARSGAAGEAGENPYIEIQLELRPYAAAGGEPPADAESSPPAQAEPESAP